jgi:hypothetical protein
MRIRITKAPIPTECRDLEGFNVSRFEIGQLYTVGPRLAELLIVCGFAEPEMRTVERESRSPEPAEGRE